MSFVERTKNVCQASIIKPEPPTLLIRIIKGMSLREFIILKRILKVSSFLAS
jgi:hypothetical protein